MNASITDLIGETLASCTMNNDKDRIEFLCESGRKYAMYHKQDCCESVQVEDICGTLSDLIGSPILLAGECVSSQYNPEELGEKKCETESFQWTFYRLATNKGYVVIRWLGESNGYYSERVDFEEVPQ